jgi:RNA-directed DNA polymerase
MPQEDLDFYSRDIARQTNLWKAWRVVQANGLSSKSARTREAIRATSIIVDGSIRSISNRLSRKKYQFHPATGVPISRPGKPARPIVSYNIDDRIVQRALLDRLLSIEALTPLYMNATSFGGLPKRGVRHAWAAVFTAIKNGATHYVRSDIHDFFTCIPKERVLAAVSDALPKQDLYLMDLLDRALQIELENMAELGQQADIFPLHEIGVAQGCCLSPLFGNLLLGDFDKEMNSNGVTCIRYIDDFIILANGNKAVRKATDRALSMLTTLGLTAYDPTASSDKAQLGLVREGINFLGCDFHPGLLGPAKKTRDRLLTSIKEVLDNSESFMDRPRTSAKFKRGLLDAFSQADNILEGWGNQYSFCNNLNIMRRLDTEIDLMIGAYLRKYRAAIFEADRDFVTRRRLLGLHLLVDSKHEPLGAPSLR